MSNVVTGLYVSAEALAQDPDYARFLMEENGVRLFVIRTGFDPGSHSPYLDEAVAAAAALDVSFQFLVGTWWGAGVKLAAQPMAPATRLLDFDVGLAHEAQWPMVAPGGDNDAAIREAIAALCDRYHPSGICLTHARFKHAADIDGLFATADGRFGAAMAEAGFTRPLLAEKLRTLSRNLQRIPPEARRATTLIQFLDTVMESDFFSRWFDFRCRQVAAAVRGVFEPIRSRHPAVQLGTNAMGPLFSRLCGQDYRQLAGSCDFVQPLLGYLDWHVLQPIRVWATLLREKSGMLEPRAALALSARLFGFEPGELALDRDCSKRAEDGVAAATIAMVQRQLGALDGFPPSRVAPVLGGPGPSTAATATLVEIVQGHGFPTILFQAGEHPPWRTPAPRTAPATPR